MNYKSRKNTSYHKISSIVPHNMNHKMEGQIMAACRQNNARFRDPSFAPTTKSLIGQPPDRDNDLDPYEFKWGSAEEIFGKGDYSVFNSIDPSDIQQGRLGDCYLLCAMSSLAERPSLIHRLFDTEEPNEYGVYAVWLNINGMWREVVVDDLFPVVQPPYQRGAIEFAFSRTSEDELWPMIIEKAYAKVYGSYSRIAAGDPIHALRDLTGAPYKVYMFNQQFTPQEIDQFWKELFDAERRGWICVCGTQSTRISEEKQVNGLLSGHAYSLLDAQNVTDSQGQRCRIVLIRNPHGQTEWNGDWSDSSHKWTPELRQQFGVKIEDDGLFWMSWEDFVKNFEFLGFCKVEQNFLYNGIQIEHQHGMDKSIIRFDVSAPGRYTISVDQKESRFFPSDHHYSCSYCRVTIGQLDRGSIKYVDCKLTPERNIFCTENLQAGQYLVLVEFYWNSKLTPEFTVSSYGVGPVGFKKVAYNLSLFQKTEYFIWKDFCNSSYAANFTGEDVKDFGRGVKIKISQYRNQRFGVVLSRFHNMSSSQCVEMSFQSSQNSGLDFISEFTSGQDLSFKVSPGSHEVLVMKTDPRVDSPGAGYRMVDYEIHDHDIPDDYSPLARLASIKVEKPVIDAKGGTAASAFMPSVPQRSGPVPGEDGGRQATCWDINQGGDEACVLI